MSDDKMKEAFEKWFAEHYNDGDLPCRYNDSLYADYYAAICWTAWQAALQSPEMKALVKAGLNWKAARNKACAEDCENRAEAISHLATCEYRLIQALIPFTGGNDDK